MSVVPNMRHHESYFAVWRKKYSVGNRTDGVAMASPVSSVVANLFVEAFDKKALRTAAGGRNCSKVLEEIGGRRIFFDQERSCRKILGPPKPT